MGWNFQVLILGSSEARMSGESPVALQCSWDVPQDLEGFLSNCKQSSKTENNEICQRTLRLHVKKNDDATSVPSWGAAGCFCYWVKPGITAGHALGASSVPVWSSTSAHWLASRVSPLLSQGWLQGPIPMYSSLQNLLVWRDQKVCLSSPASFPACLTLGAPFSASSPSSLPAGDTASILGRSYAKPVFPLHQSVVSVNSMKTSTQLVSRILDLYNIGGTSVHQPGDAHGPPRHVH